MKMRPLLLGLSNSVLTIAVGGAFIRAALMAHGTNGSGNLTLQQTWKSWRTFSGIRASLLGGSWDVFGLVVVTRTGSQTGLPTATPERLRRRAICLGVAL